MSAWRLVVKKIYECGGSATTSQLSRVFSASFNLQSALTQAKRWGVVVNNGRHGEKTIYTLTDLGLLFAAGLAELVMVGSTHPPRPQYCFKMKVTWLRVHVDDAASEVLRVRP